MNNFIVILILFSLFYSCTDGESGGLVRSSDVLPEIISEIEGDAQFEEEVVQTDEDITDEEEEFEQANEIMIYNSETGTATAGAQVNKTESKTAGIVSFDNVKTVTREDGSVIIMNKVGEIVIKTEQGDEKERYPAVYGATIFFKDGDKINVGEKILEWDPFAMPVMSEVRGRVKFEDMIVGSTVKEEVDAVTGLSHKVVTETKVKEDASKQPQIILLDEDNNPIIVPGTKRQAVYRLPIGAHITVNENDEIDAGMVVAKVQRESTKTKDIN